MERPSSEEDNSEVEEEKVNIHTGIEIRIRHPHSIVESVGKVDTTKLWVSNKEIDATIYLSDKQLETRHDMEVQYEYQKMNPEMLTATLMTQKFERFLKNIIPVIEEEIRQTLILESVLW